ncbi:hypothetical protein CR513_42915, partial [Mucuna pruriens]
MEAPCQKAKEASIWINMIAPQRAPHQGLALHWYTQLPANSIDSFVMLKRKFNMQYLTSRPHHLTPMALVNLRQGENEPLCSFMARDPPMNMDELRTRDTDYIQMKEMDEFRGSV